MLLIVLFNLSGYAITADSIQVYLKRIYAFEFLEKGEPELLSQKFELESVYENWYKLLLNPNQDEARQELILSLKRLPGSTEEGKKTDIDEFVNIFSEQFHIRVLVMQNQKYKALKHAFDVNKRISELQGKYKDNSNNEFIAFLVSIQEYFVCYLKERYVLFGLFSSNGISKSGGLKGLERATRSNDIFIRTEGCYLLMKIYNELENNSEKGLNYANWLVDTYPKNAIFRVEYLKCLKNTSISDEEFRNQIELAKKLVKGLLLERNEQIHMINVIESL